jgi:lysyl-tRNA synthetase class 1
MPIPTEASEENIKYVLERIRRAYYWTTKYAPARYRISILPEISKDVKRQLREREKEALGLFADALEARKWTPVDLKAEIYRIAREVAKISPKRFFQVIYLVFFGQKSGPQIAPFILSLDDEFVVERLRELR